MSALRSLAFGTSVLLTMLLLLVTNLGMWAFAGLLQPSAVAHAMVESLADPTLRDRVSRATADRLAEVVIGLGPLPGPVRQLLDLPARPSEARLAAALAERIDGLLADGAGGEGAVLAAAALSGLVRDALDDAAAPGLDVARDGLVVDLTPVGRMVLDRIDPSGELAGALPSGAVAIRVVSAQVTSLLVPLLRLLDAVRWMLPLACVVGVAAILLLARFRVHALAWLGLCGVVAGTASLLVASGGPALLPRMGGLDATAATALTDVLDDLTAGLVTQSAVLAGLGLAPVVAGIAGGVVVARGDPPDRDPRHGWDAGRLS
ncbi:MAG: hypothetical protein R3C32_12080 [Chloroflexota bacterium]